MPYQLVINLSVVTRDVSGHTIHSLSIPMASVSQGTIPYNLYPCRVFQAEFARTDQAIAESIVLILL